MAVLPKCCSYLRQHATGKWHETFRLKQPDSDKYMHPIQKDTLVLRVEADKRAFYWIYDTQDAINFSQYVGLTLKLEAHELLVVPYCRMFYDIDMRLSTRQKAILLASMNITAANEVAAMKQASLLLADVFKEATIISLEEHGIDRDSELVGFDWLATR
ncbi:hypothetical protein PHYBOEH_005574 [Phytophthora boehmeriae]|uniref:Uncharacterized protein n=1 Tax=Phytophthora boehmeriae TaxID=109152 RepID=A0A8T1WQU5_9STRA|nr:hypothetical protein PHYBOEH_005574 [Phytophthora boehmeriae]